MSRHMNRPPAATHPVNSLPGGRYDCRPGARDGLGWPAVGTDYSYVLFRKTMMVLAPLSQEARLILSVMDNDADPEHRLVYADFLDEQGRPDEAAVERAAAKELKALLELRKKAGVQ